MSKFTIVREFWGFIKVRKKFWLLPIVFIIIVLGLFIVISQSSALAPLIYTMF